MDLSRLQADKKAMASAAGANKSKRSFSVEKQIEKDVNNVFRFVDPDSYVMCYRSWILCDDGTSRPFVLEDSYGNQSPLLKLLGNRDDYYKGGILESVKDEASGKAKYIYDTEYKDVIEKVGFNGDRSGRRGSWKPVKQALFNVIDRDLMEVTEGETKKKIYWCKENKHTMLLWVRPTAFVSFADMIDNDGPPEDYDCNYKKTGSELKTTHSIIRAGNAVANACHGPLTEEELGYARYDLESESSVVPAGVLLYYLEKQITVLDSILGYDVLSELKTIAEIEKKERSDAEESGAASSYSEDTNFDEAPAAEAKEETPPATPAAQPATPATPPTGAPVRARKPKADVKMIICQHEGCGKSIPENAKVCPECGNAMEAPCDNCQQPFNVFEMKCPHCGQEFGEA